MRRSSFFVCFVVVVAFASVGCKRRFRPIPSDWSPPSSTAAEVKVDPPARTPTASWSGTSLSFSDYTHGSIGFSYDKAKCTARFTGFPKGTRATIGDKELTLDASSDILDVDITAAYGEIPVKLAFEHGFHFRPNVPVRLTFTNGVTFEDKLPEVPSYSLQVSKVLEGAADHPLPFAGDAKRPAARSVAYVALSSSEVFGPAKTLQDVDWIAVSSDLEAREGKTCDGYKSTKDNTSRSYVLEMQDREVAIYDRRTGNMVAKKQFKARAECPMFVMSGRASSYPSSDEIKAWLRTQRTAPLPKGV